MRITAYQTTRSPAVLEPASLRRGWMDNTMDRFAYRCLPLVIANQHGWVLRSACSFEATWTGTQDQKAIVIEKLGGQGDPPRSHFGEGVLTFSPGYLFQTEAPYALYVTGPPNIRKDGIAPLSGIVETDWLPFTFTMNWAFTRANVAVRFEESEPFCHIFPVDVSVIERFEPEVADFTESPDIAAQYATWRASREDFLRDYAVPGSDAFIKEWQRSYTLGMLPTGERVPSHRTNVKVPRFLVGHGREESKS